MKIIKEDIKVKKGIPRFTDVQAKIVDKYQESLLSQYVPRQWDVHKSMTKEGVLKIFLAL